MSSRIEDISSALTMALSNVDEEQLQGRELLRELNPTSAEFLTLAAPSSSPVREIQTFAFAGDEEEEDEDYPEEKAQEESGQDNEEMDEEMQAAREMDEIEAANRSGWWADDRYDDRYNNDYDDDGGCGLDWNESGYFD